MTEAALQKALLSGADRVTGLVARSESFRRIVARTVPKALAEIAQLESSSERRERFLEYALPAELLLPTYHCNKPFDLLCFGSTQNNRREFKFLLEILRPLRLSSGLFVQDFEPRDKSKASRALVANVVASLETWLERTEGWDAAQLWQLLRFARSYVSLAESFSARDVAAPHVAVVANDHSAGQVSFKALMDQLSVPVIYLQHAAVSPAFPPLDFEISILRDEASRDVYAMAGPARGSVFVLSRGKGPADFDAVCQNARAKEGGVSVGIYPTSTFEVESVRKVADALHENPHIRGYFTKLHPNSSVKFADADRALLRATKVAPDEPHVALVGNSAVAVELLQRGVPVYHLFGMDEVEDDYYGFVRSGLTVETDIVAVAREAFWQTGFYDDGWRTRAARFEAQSPDERGRTIAALRRATMRLVERSRDRTARHNSGDAQLRGTSWTRRLELRMKRIGLRATRRLASWVGAGHPLFARQIGEAFLKTNRSTAARDRPAPSPAARPVPERANTPSPRAALHAVLDQSSDPSRVANELLCTATNKATALDVMAWVSEAWSVRSPRAFELFRSVQAMDRAEVDPWLLLTSIESMSVPLTATEAADVVRRVRCVPSPPIRQAYATKALSVFARNGLVQESLDLIADSSCIEVPRLSSNQQVSLVRLLSQSPMPSAQQELERTLATLSEVGLLKVRAAGLLADGNACRHDDLTADFLRLMSPRLAKSFRSLVLPAYEAMRERMVFADIRTVAEQRAQLKQRIVAALADGKPYSILRLGDGEAYIFDDATGPFTEEDRQMRERHWWNIQLDEVTRSRLRSETLEAYRGADIVGVPTIHRFIRDFAATSGHLVASTANRGIVTSVRGAADLAEVPAFSEERLHHVVFDKHFLELLVQRAKRVVVVSSIQPSLLRKRFAGLSAAVVTVSLPTHAKTSGNPHYIEGTVPLPLVMESIAEEVNAIVAPGDLVLLSGGIAAKRLVAAAKAKGAVGLDLGAQLDTLVGLPAGPVG